MTRWHWLLIAALVGVVVGLLLDSVAGLVVGLLGASAGAVRNTGNATPQTDDELDDAYRPDIPDEPDTTLEQIEDEVHDAATDEVDYRVSVGPDGAHTIADDVEWADSER